MLPRGQKFYSENQRRWFAEGVAEGEAKSLREAIATALAVRSVPLSEAARARLEACGDIDRLTRWLARAVTAGTESDLFAGLDDTCAALRLWCVSAFRAHLAGAFELEGAARRRAPLLDGACRP